MHKKLLITGSGGFIGQEVLKKISGFKISRFKGDLRNISDIESNISSDVIGVLNLAARTSGSFEQLYEVNVTGTENLLSVVKDKCKNLEFFIQIGSASEYGFSKLPISEVSPMTPLNDYGKTKLKQTQLIVEAFNNTDVSVTVLRLFNVCGRDMSDKMLPVRLKKMFETDGLGVEISNKDSSRDWIDVRDVAELVIKFLEIRKPGLEIFNIGRGVAVSNLELIKAFERFTNKTKIIDETYDKADHSVANISKLKKMFASWTPRYDLKDMINYLYETD